MGLLLWLLGTLWIRLLKGMVVLLGRSVRGVVVVVFEGRMKGPCLPIALCGVTLQFKDPIVVLIPLSGACVGLSASDSCLATAVTPIRSMLGNCLIVFCIPTV